MTIGTLARQSLTTDTTGVYETSTYAAASAPTSGSSSSGINSTVAITTDSGTAASTFALASSTVAGTLMRLPVALPFAGAYPSALDYSIADTSPDAGLYISDTTYWPSDYVASTYADSSSTLATSSESDNAGVATVTFAALSGVTDTTPNDTSTLTPIGFQSITPTGIDESAFGTATVTATKRIYPTGIPDASAFGTPTVVRPPKTVSPTGIVSAEAFGTAIVTEGGYGVYPTAIDSEEAFGTATVTGGAPRIYPTGIDDGSSVTAPVVFKGYGLNATVTLLPVFTSQFGAVLRSTVTLQATLAGSINESVDRYVYPKPADDVLTDEAWFGIPVVSYDIYGSSTGTASLAEPDHTATALSGASATLIDTAGGTIRSQATSSDVASAVLVEPDHNINAVTVIQGESFTLLREPTHTLSATVQTSTVASSVLSEPAHTITGEILAWSLIATALVDDGEPTIRAEGAAIVVLDDSLPPVLVSQTITVAQGVATLSEPVHTLSAAANSPVYASASLQEPAHTIGFFGAALVEPQHAITGLFVDAATTLSEALVMNAHIYETTRWTNQPFTHVVRFDGGHVALGAGGLYTLDGTTDNTTTITATVRTHENTLGSFHLSRVPYLYTNELMQATVKPILDGAITGAYKTEGKRRVHLARGPKGRKWAFEFASNDADFQLDYLELLAEPVSRKV